MPDANSHTEVMIRAAMRALLWSELDDDGCALLDLYSPDDVTSEAWAELREDCVQFVGLLAREGSSAAFEIIMRDASQAGHDFVLTRNGHGAGFWDRGYGDAGDELTKWAKTFGEMHAYVGDDGNVHIM